MMCVCVAECAVVEERKGARSSPQANATSFASKIAHKSAQRPLDAAPPRAVLLKAAAVVSTPEEQNSPFPVITPLAAPARRSNRSRRHSARRSSRRPASGDRHSKSGNTSEAVYWLSRLAFHLPLFPSASLRDARPASSQSPTLYPLDPDARHSSGAAVRSPAPPAPPTGALRLAAERQGSKAVTRAERRLPARAARSSVMELLLSRSPPRFRPRAPLHSTPLDGRAGGRREHSEARERTQAGMGAAG